LGSGVNVENLRAKLNGLPFIDASSFPIPLQQAPEPVFVDADGQTLTVLDTSEIVNSNYQSIVLEYFPAAPTLLPANTVELDAAEDRAGNAESGNPTMNFTYP
jgi:hypothetical protein